jgi:hypothetical protein
MERNLMVGFTILLGVSRSDARFDAGFSADGPGAARAVCGLEMGVLTLRAVFSSVRKMDPMNVK